MGAVLARKQNYSRIHPVQFASRTLNFAEKTCLACERKTLAGVSVLRQFRVYLLCSTSFKLITDRQALIYAFQNKYFPGRLAPCLDFLSEYNFNVEYRRRAANGIVNYLSHVKVPGAVSSDEGKLAMAVCTYEANDLKPQLQALFSYLQDLNIDPIPKAQQARVIASSKYFLVLERRMFRRTPRGLRIIAPISSRREILRTFHDDVVHWDLRTTKQFVLERCWWRTAPKNIIEYVKSCAGCQKSTPILPSRTTLQLPITNLFKVFSVEFAGPLPPTSAETVDAPYMC